MSSASPSSSEAYDSSAQSIDGADALYVPDSFGWENEDDDDMDLEPASEAQDSGEDMGGNEIHEGLEYHDVSQDLNPVEVIFEVEEPMETAEDTDALGGGEAEAERHEHGGRNPQPFSMRRAQLLQLMDRTGIRRLFATYALTASLEDSDPEPQAYRSRPRRGRRNTAINPEPVPNPIGQDLIWRGIFGNNDRPEDNLSRRKKLAYRLMRREMGLGSYGRQKASNGSMKHHMIPSSRADMIIHYDTRCYSGQFSNDGNFFFSCGKDLNVRMYDTSNPYQWKYYKIVSNPLGNWTITDASLSSDNKYLAYSSISRIVCLATTDPADGSVPRRLDFSRSSGQRGNPPSSGRFAIWSIRFSGDGREIVAGTSDESVYVYDVERNESILRIPGHQDEVNAVCFGDAASPHILYSGSDDTTLKVWDRRSLGDGRAAGVFLGHTEGLTYVDSKGDGRYILSNGKDQTAKLWDLRKVISTAEADRVRLQDYTTDFDYRMGSFDFSSWRPHPKDCSLVTFRGHSVLETLIRCHFSPSCSSDSKYVYSGSHDGNVYIWNLDATLAGKIEVRNATEHLRRRQNYVAEPDYLGGGGYHTCVRDASWHPHAPIIAATSWGGWGTSLGKCTVHSWNDGLETDEAEPPMDLRVNEMLLPESSDEEEHFGRRSRRLRGLNAFLSTRDVG